MGLRGARHNDIALGDLESRSRSPTYRFLVTARRLRRYLTEILANTRRVQTRRGGEMEKAFVAVEMMHRLVTLLELLERDVQYIQSLEQRQATALLSKRLLNHRTAARAQLETQDVAQRLLRAWLASTTYMNDPEEIAKFLLGLARRREAMSFREAEPAGDYLEIVDSLAELFSAAPCPSPGRPAASPAAAPEPRLASGADTPSSAGPARSARSRASKAP